MQLRGSFFTAGAALLLACVLPALLAGCKDPARLAEDRARTENPWPLRHDAALLNKDYFATKGAGSVSLGQSNWPKSFLKFQPIRVRIYRDGVALALTPSADPESGIFIVPEGLNLEPAPQPRTRYHRLNDGLYHYDFGSNLP